MVPTRPTTVPTAGSQPADRDCRVGMSCRLPLGANMRPTLGWTSCVTDLSAGDPGIANGLGHGAKEGDFSHVRWRQAVTRDRSIRRDFPVRWENTGNSCDLPAGA